MIFDGPERFAPGPLHLVVDGCEQGPYQGAIRRGLCLGGRLAQLVERLVYTEDVGGSSPSSPTIPHAALSMLTMR